jgi:hypothetical protein
MIYLLYVYVYGSVKSACPEIDKVIANGVPIALHFRWPTFVLSEKMSFTLI